LNVLQVTTQSSTALKFAAPFAAWLRARGHRVTLACSGRSFADAPRQIEALRALGFEVVELDIPRAVEPLADAAAVWAAWRLMRSGRFDVVHTHNSKAGVIGRCAAALAGVPTVFHTNHGLAVEVAERYGTLEGQLHVQVERWMSRLSNLIFVVSEAERAKALRYRVAPMEKLVLVGQGIDAAYFSRAAVSAAEVEAARGALGLGPGPLVGTVSRLVAEKGLETLVEAVALMARERPDVGAVVVGEGPERGRLEALAREHGVAGRVRFVGHRSTAEVRALLAAMDVFVFPTRWESFGVVLLEAMAMEVPVVASAIAPVDGIVVAGQTGLLVGVDRPAAFARATLGLLADGEVRAAMGQRGRLRVLGHYAEEAMFRKMEAAYVAAAQARASESFKRA